ncbi:hypothetical protein QVD17_28639 [Tagetes erecta]|uniref:Uncharacterized protein n=1 Tax=Tagetes erecta TaxID=13708 RepID=A0AAD8KD84_TARER|nr:hypothetical protein QVD17_28639 [Tagetes erecta]
MVHASKDGLNPHAAKAFESYQGHPAAGSHTVEMIQASKASQVLQPSLEPNPSQVHPANEYHTAAFSHPTVEHHMTKLNQVSKVSHTCKDLHASDVNVSKESHAADLLVNNMGMKDNLNIRESTTR